MSKLTLGKPGVFYYLLVYFTHMKTKEEIINQLIGNTCWRAWRGAGPAIFFEFGEKLPDRKGGEPRKGTYSIGFSCPWQVFKDGQVWFNYSSNLNEMDQKIMSFTNTEMTGIKFDSDLHEETLVFSNGLEIKTYHNQADDQWHILTPEVECVFYQDKVEIGPLD